MDNYNKKTIQELISICKEKKIKGYSSLKKDSLIQIINKNCDCIKFRWSFEKLLNLFKDNFEIIDLSL